MKKLINLFARAINYFLGLMKFKLVRTNVPYTDYRDYIPFKQTLHDANEAGLSVGDFVDSKHHKGSTQNTIDQMVALGVFKCEVERVCEIGPGTGRYLEKTIQICHPKYYEIYETAAEWESWLVQKHHVTSQPTDGKSLSSTPSNSMDLVQAHKVLPGQPTLTICGYFDEMARVVCAGGKVVFDIVTEDCLGEDVLAKWISSGWGYQHYPSLMPKQFTIDFFQRRNLSFDGSFLVPMEPGLTECFVFTKLSE